MKNIIMYADEVASKAREAGLDWKQVSANVQDAALAEHPVYLGLVTSVVYLEKSDRYVVKFHGGTSSVRVTPAVAEFLLTEVFSPKRAARPTVYAHMTDGVVDGALLLFISRQ